jgi:hypothetical protein
MSALTAVNSARHPGGRGRPALVAVYAVSAAAGLAGTWFYNLRARTLPGGFPGGYLRGWFANPASSSAAVDLISVFAVSGVFMVVEGRRVGMKAPWAYPLLALPSALAFTFPLFLLVRERHLHPTGAHQQQAGPPRR